MGVSSHDPPSLRASTASAAIQGRPQVAENNNHRDNILVMPGLVPGMHDLCLSSARRPLKWLVRLWRYAHKRTMILCAGKGGFVTDIQQVLTELKGSTDRAIAIVCAATLDEALQDLLSDSLKKAEPGKDDTLRGTTKAFLLGIDGPIGAFGVRAKLAYMLNLIDDETLEDLQKIATIRNKFAHHSDCNEFESSRVINTLRSMHAFKRMKLMVEGSKKDRERLQQDDGLERVAASIHGRLGAVVEIDFKSPKTVFLAAVLTLHEVLRP